jgi:hypothetical protein
MKKHGILLVLFLAGICLAQQPPAVKNAVVFKESGRFGGWPANNGIWSWGDEIVVGLVDGAFKKTDRGHAIDGSQPSFVRFARSLDGGETWTSERAPFMDEQAGEKDPVELTTAMDFSNPNFAARFRMNGNGREPSRIYYSTDRAKTWQGPYKLPLFDQPRVMARTDYLVNGKHDLIAFITAAKQDNREGRVFVTQTKDGGRTWQFVTWIGPEPAGFAIMPSSVRLSANQILTTIRRKEGPEHFIDAYLSSDNGKTWEFLNKPAESTGGSVGNPPAMVKLQDGRLAMTYGYRSEPYGMRARLSEDEGRTWGPEIILRDDAGCWDLGYPRAVQRSDGKIVTVYYYNDHLYSERYIAATIWDPGKRD